jgi:hypothetical protein
MKDSVLTGLELAERQLLAEIEPLNRLIRDVQRLIMVRKAMQQPRQLLCERLHEVEHTHAIASWETEGGAVR